MQPQWFYYLAGRARGPVTVAELRRLLKSNRLQSTDRVRFITDDQWMLVSDFLVKVGDSPKSMPDEVASDEPARDRPGFEYLAGVVSYPRELFSQCLSVVRGCWSSLGEVLSGISAWRWGALLATTIVAVFIVSAGRFVLRGGADEKAMSAQMLQIANELDLLQGRSTSSVEWQQFQEQASKTLAPLQQFLETRARSSPRTRTHYWTESGYQQSVARSHLIQAGKALFTLINSRGGDDSHFYRQINQAKDQLAGRSPKPPVRRSPVGRSEWDSTMLGMIGFDAILVLGGAVYWWSRRSK